MRFRASVCYVLAPVVLFSTRIDFSVPPSCGTPVDIVLESDILGVVF